MNADAIEIKQLRDQAEELPYGPTKVALLEEAVARADALNDIHLAYDLRTELLTAATFSGRPDVLLVAFSWVRAHFDKESDSFHTLEFLWKYKWVVGKGPDFPEITRAQIEEMLADFERRVLAEGYSKFTVLAKRRDAELDLNDPEAAAITHRKMKDYSPDVLSDCSVCRVGHDCRYYEYLEDWQKVVAIGEDAINRKLRCEVQPLGILGRLLNSLLRLGRVEQAREYHRSALRLLARSGNAMGSASSHIRFLARVGEYAKAAKLVERYMPTALSTPDLNDRYHFLQASRLLGLAMTAAGHSTIRLRLPDATLEPTSRGKYDLPSFLFWLETPRREIARRFDARNGNHVMEQWVDRLPEELEFKV